MTQFAVQQTPPEMAQQEPKQFSRRRSSLGSSFVARVSSILDRKSKSNPVSDIKVAQVLAELTEDETETAARASYVYVQNPALSRDQHAQHIVRRYLESKKGNVPKATQRLKTTLAFRKEIDIEGLMGAFQSENKYTSPLEEHLSSKKLFVQGYDNEGRSTLFFIPRNVQGHDVEWTLKEAVYSIERAIACTKAADGTINAVVDFSGFSVSKHSPPLEIGKQFLTTLRSHYAGQIHKIFLVDTPFTFSILWKVFQPFVGTNTRQKIQFVSGKKSKKQLESLYALEQVPDWMIPGGEKNRELDLNEYLYESSFDTSFNETK